MGVVTVNNYMYMEHKSYVVSACSLLLSMLRRISVWLPTWIALTGIITPWKGTSEGPSCMFIVYDELKLSLYIYQLQDSNLGLLWINHCDAVVIDF